MKEGLVVNTLAEVAHKTCIKCQVSKPVDCFHKCSSAKDGLQGKCKVCVKKYTAQYYLDNLEQIKSSSKKYVLDNPEKHKTNNKKWRLANPAKVKASVTKHRLANLEKYRHVASARRARKLANGVFKISTKELKKLYNSPCSYCGSKDSIEMDHVIPLVKGGRHSIGNLVPACAKCNRSKHDKLLVEWRAIR
jgi:5-methylcytosine-specific restriction endonuclease McrA